MNRLHQIVTTASAASLMAFAAFGQETSSGKTNEAASARAGGVQEVRGERSGQPGKASVLMGMQVENYDGARMGKVADIAVDLEAGRVVVVLLSTGGFAGLGSMTIPIPPAALHQDGTNKVLHLRADNAKLKASPGYGMLNWAELGDSNRVAEVYRYHGQEPYFAAVKQPDRGPDPTARLGYIQRTTKLMGVDVRNVQGERLGKVEDLVVDLSAGRLISVVVSSGGFLGVGEELRAVPPAAFQFNSEHKHLQLDLSKESFVKAPHFKSTEWPDFGQPAYASEVYRAYRMEPYFSTKATAAAGDTARIDRERKQKSLTPLDQGNSQADVDTTAQIRKGIMADKEMSVNGRNVKVITNRGQVTLRGPVDTAEEKRLIGVIAIDVALVGNVDNQLEVK